MAKDKLTDYDSVASGNLDVGGISVAEGMLPSGVNNAIREQMSHLADFAAGTQPITKLATASIDANGGTIKLDGNYPVGTANVALGDAALDDGSLSGAYNTALGSSSLSANTTGQGNTATGYTALLSNSTGNENSAFGQYALYDNSTGSNNVAIGRSALENNTIASNNTALGGQSAYNVTTGSSNTIIGSQAGYTGTSFQHNCFVGTQAGYFSTGTGNTFIGASTASIGSGGSMTTGSKNTIIGAYNGNQGGLDIRTASNNIVLSDGDGNPWAYRRGADGNWYFDQPNDSEYSLRIRSLTSSTSPYGLAIQYPNTAPDNTSARFITCSDSSTSRFYVYNDGDVANHDNSYGAISDVKLKEQITDASSQWDDIKALTVRKYKMKSDVTEKGDSDDLWRLGVVAQEVEAAGMSGLVKESPDRDADNNDLGTTTKEVKYSILYMKAVKALQEAMDRIETLEAKVAALESN